MYKNIIIIFFALLLTTNVSADEKRYQIKKAHISYQLSGQTNGTEELFFDNWGKNEARYSNHQMSIFGIKQNIQNTFILDGDWAYSIDDDSKVATKSNYKEMMQIMMKQQGQSIDYSPEMIKSIGGKKIGTEKILGKKCTIWEIEQYGSKVWEWKGIPFKNSSNFMGIEMNIIATAFKENENFDPSKLKLPKGTKIENAPEITDEQMQAMENMQNFQQSADYKQMQQELEKARQEMKQAQEQSPPNNTTTRTINGMGDTAEDAMQESLNEATREGVKSAVGGLMKGIFGR